MKDNFNKLADAFDTIGKKIETVSEKIQKVKSDIEKVNEDLESGKAERIIGDYIGEKIKGDLEKIYNNSVSAFYKSYEPIYYTRLNSLYNMYNIVYNKNNYSVDDKIGYEYALPTYNNRQFEDTQHRVEAKYIYEKMFVEGWHGGATHSNKRDFKFRTYPAGFEMAYRTPYDQQEAEANGVPRFGLWSYYKVQRESISPKKNAQNQIKRYEKGKSNSSGSDKQKRVQEGIQYFRNRYDFFKQY